MQKICAVILFLVMSCSIRAQQLSEKKLSKIKNYLFSVHNSNLDSKIQLKYNSENEGIDLKNWILQDKSCIEDTIIPMNTTLMNTKLIQSGRYYLYKASGYLISDYCIYDDYLKVPYKVQSINLFNEIMDSIKEKKSNFEKAFIYLLIESGHSNAIASNSGIKNFDIDQFTTFHKDASYENIDPNKKKQKIFVYSTESKDYESDKPLKVITILFDQKGNIKKVKRR